MQKSKSNNSTYLFFFGENDNKNGYLSNFFQKTSFIIDGVEYKTTEHYFMAMKAKQWKTSKNDDLFNRIIKSAHPKEAKSFGRQVEKYNETEWSKVRFNIMVEGLRNKFLQNPEYKEKLLSTKEMILVEASPYDSIWGIGMTVKDAYSLSEKEWQSILENRNLLGKALMKVRTELQ